MWVCKWCENFKFTEFTDRESTTIIDIELTTCVSI